MAYRHDMSQENERHEFENLPNGWREFIIKDCKESVSKKGNEQFVFLFEDEETSEQGDIYAIAVPKRRWFLKQILFACNIVASEDGIYDWGIPDVLEKRVMGLVVSVQEEWIDRNGDTQTKVRPRINQVKAVI